MKDYIITCTSVCDLDPSILKNRRIPYACFKMIVDDREYDDDFFASYPYEKFYDDIAGGMTPTTSQVGYYDCMKLFESILKEGKDVLHLTVSSALSGDYGGAESIAAELNEKYSNKVTVVDSLGASSGYGMLVLLARDRQEKGMSLQENVQWILENRQSINHWFISTDLTSFIRGGRLSKAAGFLGSALRICPLMNMPADGTISICEKIRTKKKALAGLLAKMEECALNLRDYDGPVYISQSRMEEDSEELKQGILERFPYVKEVRIFPIGTTIGAHTGPGTIALFFLGKERK